MTATRNGETTMKIYVSRVPEEGLKEHASYDPRGMEMERDDIHLDEPFEVDAFIVKADRELVVNAAIHCSLRLTCARCLEDVRTTLQSEAIFSYQVRPTDMVDITDDVRQEIVLAYPMIPLCRASCKGLCSTCGQNLNVASCSHHAAQAAE